MSEMRWKIFWKVKTLSGMPEHERLAGERAALAFAEVARPLILENFTPDSCVASTRIGIDALRAFGVLARPLPVHVRIFNQEMATLLMAGIKPTGRHTADSEGGPWMVDLGNPVEGDPRAAGHVAIAIPALGLLLDPSIDQANRPHKNIRFPAGETLLWKTGSEEFPNPGWEETRGTDEGVVIVYEAVDAHRYRKSPNWRADSGLVGGRRSFRETTGAIVRAMRERLESS